MAKYRGGVAPLLPFVTILVRFVRAVAGSWKDQEFRGFFFLVVVTLTTVGYGTRLPHRAVHEALYRARRSGGNAVPT